MILKKLLPRQDNFFNYFRQLAEKVNQAARLFKELVGDTADAPEFAKQIASIETKGDEVAQEAYNILHHTFITPFDRNDILELLRKLDDILDLINRSAKRIAVYKTQQLTPQIIEIADMALSASEKIIFIMSKLNDLKNRDEILKACQDLSDLERKADQTKMAGMQVLFENETDFKHFYKIAELYDYSKAIVSECHHLANIVKGIVLEYA